MKICAIFSTLTLLLLAFGCKGGEFNWPIAQNTVYTNGGISFSAATNGVLASTNIATTNILNSYKSIYHTFQGVVASNGTNSELINIDSTLDGTDWTPIYTNSGTQPTNFEFQFTGISIQFRERFSLTVTNTGSANIFYAGR